MTQTLTQYDFINAFKNSSLRSEQFSYDALVELFNYYEEYEECTGETIEFDMVAICCDWKEYDNIQEALDYYGKDDLEDLQDYTQVIEFDTGVLVMNF